MGSFECKPKIAWQSGSSSGKVSLALQADGRTLLDGHVQAVLGVNGGPSGHADIMSRHSRESVALEHDRHGDNCLHESKLVSDALAGAATEGDVPAPED